MMTSLLFALVVLGPQQQLEQQLQRQQQQIEEIRREARENGQALKEMRSLLESREQQGKPFCSAEMRWVNGGEPKRVQPGASTTVQLSFFSVVSKPSNGCLPAEIRLTASYLDAGGNQVCSGVIENIAVQNALAQSINLEIRPWNLREFARWRNEPPQVNSGPKMLVCMNLEGLAEATSDELGRVAAVRVRATVLPASGGMSTQEAQITFR
jgi:hypothetical protein